MPKRVLVFTASLFLVATAVFAVRAEETAAKPCKGDHPCPSPSPTGPPSATVTPSVSSSGSPPPSSDQVITAAGDIAKPVPSSATHATAELVTSINPSVALTLGDNQYPSGSLSDYQKGYASTWGAFLPMTSPTPGNHEYNSSSTAAGYFAYFGSRAPAAYYSYDVGAWHLISLNSNCTYVGGCGAGSPEYTWLEADLASNPAACTLAYWHHPRWSSGSTHGGTASVAAFWTLLYGAGAEVVLNGHEHNYERFAPQDPSGELDAAKGIVEFVVGTGGEGLYPFGSTHPHSIARSATAFGVLELTLHPTSYEFAFQPVPGATFTDSGSSTCH